MEKRPISVEELFDFAHRNNGREFKTITRHRRFTLEAAGDRLRILLPSQTYFTVQREYAEKYLGYYNRLPWEDSSLTTPYPSLWRERSYMVKVMQMARSELEKSERKLPIESPADHSKFVGRRDWTKDELFVALNLYHKLTFGQFHQRQPVVIATAGRMDRTPSSLAMKLSNLASLDPALKMRGIKGLSGASRLDEAAWKEFHENLNETAPASEEAFQKLFDAEKNDGVEVTPKGITHRKMPQGATERTANVKARRGQDYFRDSVLNNFDGKCGITGLAVRELLIASHILPWGECEAERLNIRNGIALSRLHDAAFDLGLITFDDRLCLQMTKALRGYLPQKTVKECFAAYEGEALQMSEHGVPPDEKFLAMHRAKALKKWA